MRIKSIICILLNILLAFAARGQEFTITGQFYSEKHPVEYGLVTLSRKGGVAFVAKTPTDTLGNFSIHAVAGDYILRLVTLGEPLLLKNITVSGNVDLGIIEVGKSATDLAQVEISVRKKLIEHKVDRTIFNLENSISATGGDAIDALSITPGIKVQNDAISMIGKSKMAVMIDDRIIQFSGDDLMNFLRSIKVDAIKSIEVITTPPAKYDAEGNSGLINIQLKKLIQDSWNLNINASSRNGAYTTNAGGASLNYKQKKLSLSASANYTNGDRKSTETEQIEYVSQTWQNHIDRKLHSDLISGKLAADFAISKKWSIGGQYLGSYSKPKNNGLNISNVFSKRNSIDSVITTNLFDGKTVKTNSVNIHSIVKMDSIGNNISFDFDFLNYGNDNDRVFQTQNAFSNNQPTPYGFNSSKNIGIQDIRIYAIKSDLETPLKWVDLKYGVKFSSLTTNNNNLYYNDQNGNFIINSNISNVFNYQEQTTALYVSGEKEISAKWSSQLGLRVEGTNTIGNSITLNQISRNKYLQFFPTAYIQYKLNADNQFFLKYNRRLSRPRYSELNPFKIYYSPYNYSEGNPYLKPEFITTVELNHAFKDYLNTSISYTHIKNGKGNPPFFDQDTKVTYLKDLNFYSTNILTLSESYIFNKIKWWESENQIEVYYSTINFLPQLGFSNTKGWGSYFSSNNRLLLNKAKSLKAEVNFWYQSPQYQDLYRFKASMNLNLGLSYAILHKTLIVSGVFNDIFKTNYEKARAVTSTPYHYTSYGDQRFFRVSISYLIGNKKLVVKKVTPGNEDEKKRIEN